MVKPIERWIRKYEDRASVAVEDYKWGVQNPSASPIEQAIAHKEDLMKKMAKKETWDKWEEALKFVGDEGWVKGCLEKGVDRYPTGIRVGVDKYKDFASKFKEHLEKGVAEVKKLPKVTLEDSIKRAEKMIRHNAMFRYKKAR